MTTSSPSTTRRQSSLCTNTSHQPASLQAEYFDPVTYEFETQEILFLLGLCGLHHADTKIGQLHHYRKDCYQDPCPLAEKVVRDDRVWTHLDTVIQNSNKAFQTIDLE